MCIKKRQGSECYSKVVLIFHQVFLQSQSYSVTLAWGRRYPLTYKLVYFEFNSFFSSLIKNKKSNERLFILGEIKGNLVNKGHTYHVPMPIFEFNLLLK